MITAKLPRIVDYGHIKTFSGFDSHGTKLDYVPVESAEKIGRVGHRESIEKSSQRPSDHFYVIKSDRICLIYHMTIRPRL